MLKGETLRAKRTFFEQTSSLTPNPRENIEAYRLWMEKLNSRQDRLPWSWTQKLVVSEPDHRWTAEELLQQIQGCNDPEDGFMYHCTMCDDADSEIPVPDTAARVEHYTDEEDCT